MAVLRTLKLGQCTRKQVAQGVMRLMRATVKEETSHKTLSRLTVAGLVGSRALRDASGKSKLFHLTPLALTHYANWDRRVAAPRMHGLRESREEK